jgi:hypothetical protein
MLSATLYWDLRQEDRSSQTSVTHCKHREFAMLSWNRPDPAAGWIPELRWKRLRDGDLFDILVQVAARGCKKREKFSKKLAKLSVAC